MRRKNKSLLLLLLILGIGFAAIGTTLYINGNATISSNNSDFDVKFTKAIRGEEDISSTAISADGKSITYDTEDLSEKDNQSILTYTVKNNSSLYDADVSVNCTAGTHNDLYSVTNNLDSPIEAKSSKDGTITVKLLQNSEEEISEEFTCTLTATAIERTTIETGVNKNIGNVLKYDQTEGSSTYCVTGDEETCTDDLCVKNKTTCAPGTIINYKVNDTETKRFYVLHDDGDSLTLQQNSNVADAVSWTSNYSYFSTYGPDAALAALEQKTNTWDNVNTLNYSIGDENTTLGYSGCPSSGNCSSSVYSLSRSDVKARIITLQELQNVCSTDSCYLKWIAGGYYTLSAMGNGVTWWIKNYTWGSTADFCNSSCSSGVRAVVEINK